MRRILMCGTAAIALMGTPVMAGGVAEPTMEPTVVAAATSSSSAGILVPLLLLLLIAAAVSGGSQDGGMASDARLKTDIQWVGMAKGLPLYQFRYNGHAAVFEGVMAQDVLRIRPDAVMHGSTGLMAVNYAKLGLAMRRVH